MAIFCATHPPILRRGKQDWVHWPGWDPVDHCDFRQNVWYHGGLLCIYIYIRISRHKQKPERHGKTYLFYIFHVYCVRHMFFWMINYLCTHVHIFGKSMMFVNPNMRSFGRNMFWVLTLSDWQPRPQPLQKLRNLLGPKLRMPKCAKYMYMYI